VTFLEALRDEIDASRTLWLIGGLVLTALVLHSFAPVERRRVRGMSMLVGLHLVLLPVHALFVARDQAGSQGVRLALRLFEVLAVVGMAGTVLYAALLPRVRLPVPKILQDVTMAVAALVACFITAAQAGFNLSGLITTSAVLTAVIGFSLQDTLGNIMGGLALQMDNSLRVGEWIKFGDIGGKVSEIRWRYTAVMTRNGETVLIPNGMLMKSQVTVLARGLQPGRWRRWVWFNVDFRHQPSDVIEAVEAALRSAPIANVAADPPPNCVCMEIADSQCKYAVRYWLTDPQPDDPTDSIVRTRVFFALARARIKLSMPAHAIFVTQESEQRDVEKEQEEHARRVAALRRVDLFASLDDKEIAKLAGDLRYAPFTAGETMTRQGAEAHWLYVITEGVALVRVEVDGVDKEVARLSAGQFFGEMSLMTGRPREATVVAATDVECYRLVAESFKGVLHAHPDHTEKIAEAIGKRRAELEAVRQGLSEEAKARRALQVKEDLAGKIREFFGL
jgi:small-conductance mechanosensitive channel/CRP-like cAMP-binding protein